MFCFEKRSKTYSQVVHAYIETEARGVETLVRRSVRAHVRVRTCVLLYVVRSTEYVLMIDLYVRTDHMHA